MKKNINIVLIGVLTVASIILALPFTPLRNSFKGVTSNAADKALTSLGVDLKGKIINARQISAAHQYETSNMNLGLIVDSKGRVVKSNNYRYTNLSQDSYNPNNFTEILKSGNINGIKSSFGGSGSKILNSSQSVKDIVLIPTKLGATTVQTSQTGMTTKESTSQTDGTGGGVRQGVHGGPTPEEGTGGIPPSLPIGNGTLFLLSLAILYGTWKIKSSII